MAQAALGVFRRYVETVTRNDNATMGTMRRRCGNTGWSAYSTTTRDPEPDRLDAPLDHYDAMMAVNVRVPFFAPPCSEGHANERSGRPARLRQGWGVRQFGLQRQQRNREIMTNHYHLTIKSGLIGLPIVEPPIGDSVSG